MTTPSESSPVLLLVLIAVQFGCALFFVADITHDLASEGGFWKGLTSHLAVELIAAIGLFSAILLEGRLLQALLRRKARLETRLAQASTEVHEAISAQFEEWRLSPSETDIAMFLVKGLGTQEIADLRGSAEGTVKAQFNSIFRKAGAHSRAELLSLLIDRILGARLARER